MPEDVHPGKGEAEDHNHENDGEGREITDAAFDGGAQDEEVALQLEVAKDLDDAKGGCDGKRNDGKRRSKEEDNNNNNR